MNWETLKTVACAIAARNGTLQRLPNGRWKGDTKDQQIPADVIAELVADGKLQVTARHLGATGFATSVSVRNPYEKYEMS